MNKPEALIAIALIAAMPALLIARELRPETLNAWNHYIQNIDMQMQARLDGHSPFLWMDESADRQRRITDGEIVVEPVIHTASGVSPMA